MITRKIFKEIKRSCIPVPFDSVAAHSICLFCVTLRDIITYYIISDKLFFTAIARKDHILDGYVMNLLINFFQRLIDKAS